MAERQWVLSGSPYEPRIGFARAVRLGNVVSVSGTAPIGPDGRTAGVGDAAAQAQRCIEIIREALAQLGLGLETVVRTRIYLTNIADWEQVGLVHGQFFGDIRPACTFVQVSRFIDADWLVEVEADAWAEL